MPNASVFKRYLLPGFAFQSVVIAGGYGTGRELTEFFLTIGPLDGLVAMVLVSTIVWSAVAAASFELEPELAEFAAKIRDFAANTRDVIDQAALMWKVVHGVAERFHVEQPSWRFLRHEDLSLDPTSGFRALYASLDLQFTGSIERALEAATSAANPGAS